MTSPKFYDKNGDLPSPPFINVANIPNFRDLGGYAISHLPKHSVRRHFIYRCAEPSRITPDGVSTLRSLGITHAFDLRSPMELERRNGAGLGGITEWDGCERVFVPVFTAQNSSPKDLVLRYKDYGSDGTEGFIRAYSDILEKAPPSYKQILSHLANEPSKPLIIHCTAGKDRTGIICALVLSLCGVDDETVAYEYSLTELGMADFREAIIAHLAASPAFAGNEEGAKNMSSAKAVNMLSTLEIIRKKYGGAEGYVVKKCGLTNADVEKIRANLIVEASPITQLVR